MNSDTNLKEVTIKGVFMVNILGRSVPAVMLEDEEGSLMPIHIGNAEALSINSVLKSETMPRPMTHDLIITMLERLGTKIESVFIDEKIDNIYYARLRLDREGSDIEFDARPSDCIAMALRQNAPILIDRDIFADDSIDKENFQLSKSSDDFE
ncbi:bifunctional nuclease family protein [Methanolobus zinderi]|uniref:Bifunctional nuclease family protein n=2 Tax=Methanolobus zinderi TaxID=536044 RepID=A0A7D5E5A9_9EURY|nr:bifunctional nuclease family protein [Methanolobus zinderi]